MKVSILGVRPVQFTASDGRLVAGSSLYIGYESEGVNGMAAEKIFVSAEKLPKKPIVPGSDVEIVFNMRGKVEAIITEN